MDDPLYPSTSIPWLTHPRLPLYTLLLIEVYSPKGGRVLVGGLGVQVGIQGIVGVSSGVSIALPPSIGSLPSCTPSIPTGTIGVDLPGGMEGYQGVYRVEWV